MHDVCKLRWLVLLSLPTSLGRALITVRFNAINIYHLCYSRGLDTLLGETADPCELFLVDECDDNPLGAILNKINVS